MTDCQPVGFCILHCALFIVHFALSSLRGLHCAVCDEHLMHYAQETKLVFMNEKAESENRKPFEKSEKSARCAYACFMTAAALLQTEVSPETEKCFLASHDAYAEIIVCAKNGTESCSGKIIFQKNKKSLRSRYCRTKKRGFYTDFKRKRIAIRYLRSDARRCENRKRALSFKDSFRIFHYFGK